MVIATEGGHYECVRLLAEAKANLNLTYSDNELCAVHRYCTMFGRLHVCSCNDYIIIIIIISKSCFIGTF